jgi:hypothetical protein
VRLNMSDRSEKIPIASSTATIALANFLWSDNSWNFNRSVRLS